MKKFWKFITFALLFCVFTKNAVAANELIVTWETSPNGPVFSLDDFKPGDCTEKQVVVKNDSDVATTVAVRSTNIEDSILSQAVSMEIYKNLTLIYGPQTLGQFFLDSSGTDGLILSPISPNEEITYKFRACFDITAGNEYQKTKVIFDLVFGEITADHIVINEVFYDVDSSHGSDSPKDSNNIISGNGAGSTNIIDTKFINTCIVVQKNNTNVSTNLNANSGTGRNIVLGNTNGGVVISTGNAGITINFLGIGSINIGGKACSNKKGQSDEWVELYNPTNTDISLKNWVLEDDSGTQNKINANKIIKKKGFALISKDADTWRFWNEDPDAIKIELGQNIGDGLGDGGDHLHLKRPTGQIEDSVGWESDIVVWTTNQPSANTGNSIERLTPGFDFNFPSDFQERVPPTPGN